MALILAPLLLVAAQAVAPPASAAVAVPQTFVSRRGGRLFISPMGEPFRPKDRDDDTIADWFNQADGNHDGRLTLDEMKQDAGRFFATLDIGKDGEIDPEDVTRYETQVAPEIQSAARFGLASFDEERQDGGPREGGRHGSKGPRPRFVRNDNDQHQGAGRYGLLDLPEPVVSADADFNRGVSLNEFKSAAQQRFLALDLDHHGYLTLPALEAIRPAPPAAPNARQRQGDPDEHALPDQG
jgi:hypothetical protein